MAAVQPSLSAAAVVPLLLLLALLALSPDGGTVLVNAAGAPALPITDGYYERILIPNPDLCEPDGPIDANGVSVCGMSRKYLEATNLCDVIGCGRASHASNVLSDEAWMFQAALLQYYMLVTISHTALLAMYTAGMMSFVSCCKLAVRLNDGCSNVIGILGAASCRVGMLPHGQYTQILRMTFPLDIPTIMQAR